MAKHKVKKQSISGVKNNMHDAFEYRGIWWLPETPEKQVNGTINFAPETGITLDLVDTLTQSREIYDNFSILLILGKSLSGDIFTLHNCRLSYYSHGEFLASTYLALDVFIGVHFLTLEEIKFKRIRTHFANLNEWVSPEHLSVNSDDQNKIMTIQYET